MTFLGILSFASGLGAMFFLYPLLHPGPSQANFDRKQLQKTIQQLCASPSPLSAWMENQQHEEELLVKECPSQATLQQISHASSEPATTPYASLASSVSVLRKTYLALAKFSSQPTLPPKVSKLLKEFETDLNFVYGRIKETETIDDLASIELKRRIKQGDLSALEALKRNSLVRVSLIIDTTREPLSRLHSELPTLSFLLSESLIPSFPTALLEKLAQAIDSVERTMANSQLQYSQTQEVSSSGNRGRPQEGDCASSVVERVRHFAKRRKDVVDMAAQQNHLCNQLTGILQRLFSKQDKP